MPSSWLPAPMSDATTEFSTSVNDRSVLQAVPDFSLSLTPHMQSISKSCWLYLKDISQFCLESSLNIHGVFVPGPPWIPKSVDGSSPLGASADSTNHMVRGWWDPQMQMADCTSHYCHHHYCHLSLQPLHLHSCNSLPAASSLASPHSFQNKRPES